MSMFLYITTRSFFRQSGCDPVDLTVYFIASPSCLYVKRLCTSSSHFHVPCAVSATNWLICIFGQSFALLHYYNTSYSCGSFLSRIVHYPGHSFYILRATWHVRVTNFRPSSTYPTGIFQGPFWFWYLLCYILFSIRVNEIIIVVAMHSHDAIFT
jgi:hypothetical protein